MPIPEPGERKRRSGHVVAYIYRGPLNTNPFNAFRSLLGIAGDVTPRQRRSRSSAGQTRDLVEQPMGSAAQNLKLMRVDRTCGNGRASRTRGGTPFWCSSAYPARRDRIVHMACARRMMGARTARPQSPADEAPMLTPLDWHWRIPCQARLPAIYLPSAIHFRVASPRGRRRDA
jgi:hypothetical protein